MRGFDPQPAYVTRSQHLGQSVMVKASGWMGWLQCLTPHGDDESSVRICILQSEQIFIVKCNFALVLSGLRKFSSSSKDASSASSSKTYECPSLNCIRLTWMDFPVSECEYLTPLYFHHRVNSLQ